MAARTIPFMRIEALAALGAERLAEILRESARDDPRLRERLEAALAGSPPIRTKPQGAIVSSIKRRIAALEEMDGYHDWRGAASVGVDIDTIRQDIMEIVLAEDTESATGLLEQLVGIEQFLLETTDDSDGEISDALHAVVDDWGRAWARVVERDAETVTGIVFDAFTRNGHGTFDEVIPAFEEALGTDGLAALEARFRSALEGEAEPDDPGDWREGRSRRVLLSGLGDIADLRGDVDAFIASHEAAGTDRGYAVRTAVQN